MIVADANLVAYIVLPGERTADAEAVFAKDPSWAVPLLCISELRSVMLRYLRTGDLSLTEAIGALERTLALVDGREVAVDSRQVLELAKRSGCSSYDCEYVALAEVLGVWLVTADAKVLKAFPTLAVSPTGFV